MNTYIATAPDGTKLTRNSKRVYTHAVIVKDIHRGRYLASWSSRLDLALKQAEKDRQLVSFHSEVLVVEVEVVA